MDDTIPDKGKTTPEKDILYA